MISTKKKTVSRNKSKTISKSKSKSRGRKNFNKNRKYGSRTMKKMRGGSFRAELPKKFGGESQAPPRPLRTDLGEQGKPKLSGMVTETSSYGRRPSFAPENKYSSLNKATKNPEVNRTKKPGYEPIFMSREDLNLPKKEDVYATVPNARAQRLATASLSELRRIKPGPPN